MRDTHGIPGGKPAPLQSERCGTRLRSRRAGTGCLQAQAGGARPHVFLCDHVDDGFGGARVYLDDETNRASPFASESRDAVCDGQFGDRRIAHRPFCLSSERVASAIEEIELLCIVDEHVPGIGRNAEAVFGRGTWSLGGCRLLRESGARGRNDGDWIRTGSRWS